MDTHFTSSPRAQFSCFLKLFIFALGDNAVLLSYCTIKRTSPFEPNTCFSLERMMGKCLFKSLCLSTFLIYKKSLITQIPRGLVKRYSRPKSKRKGKIKYCLSLATTGTNPWQWALKVTRPLLSLGVKIQKQVVSAKKNQQVTWCLWTPALGVFAGQCLQVGSQLRHTEYYFSLQDPVSLSRNFPSSWTQRWIHLLGSAQDIHGGFDLSWFHISSPFSLLWQIWRKVSQCFTLSYDFHKGLGMLSI